MSENCVRCCVAHAQRRHKGGNMNRVCFEGGSYLSVRYCEQRRGEGELCTCVGTVAWQGDMISGQRVVCVQVHGNNWQRHTNFQPKRSDLALETLVRRI